MRAALGGRASVSRVETAASRLLLSVNDASLIDREAMRRLGIRGVAMPATGQLIVGPAAASAGASLKGLLA